MDDGFIHRIASQVKATVLASWFLEEQKLKNELAELQQTIEQSQQAIEQSQQTIEAAQQKAQQKSQHARQSIESANARKEEIASILSTQRRIQTAHSLDNFNPTSNQRENQHGTNRHTVWGTGAHDSRINTNLNPRKRQLSGEGHSHEVPQSKRVALFRSLACEALASKDLADHAMEHARAHRSRKWDRRDAWKAFTVQVLNSDYTKARRNNEAVREYARAQV
ncbi:hypothetical protein QBC37DRAFT_404544 [Rhypophila decipiens]|uniref:Uncharacterized protein n=1 Tax=Rhypophila decipiens TaxID=261697 RepID=A0AAN6XYV8_9PEZI|nr:hypothetical protein QBC37DRAFT_404544 [Rhypophila decipiens]